MKKKPSHDNDLCINLNDILYHLDFVVLLMLLKMNIVIIFTTVPRGH